MQLKFKLGIAIGGVVLLAIIIGVFIALASDGDVKSPKVYFSQGQIQGKKYYSRNGKSFYGYHNIPYAEKPKRFQPSIEAATMWEGVRDGMKYGPACTQFVKGKVIGSEDCLLLNVFTSNLNGSLPVMFYLYGGGFSEGHAGLYKPDFIMDEEVVLVTFNYRVGAFGFLCTDDGEVQGNMGLKDQSIALRWVKRNIISFGGDPKRVTIFGSSAGAASVSYHVLSPMSRQLFNNAIMQSGSSLNPWAINLRSTGLVQKLGLQINCITTRSMRELIQCIKDKPAAAIANQTFIKWYHDPHITWAPCIERTGPEMTRFLSEHPHKLLKDGKYNRVNIILGITKDEGLLFHAASLLHNKTVLAQLNQQFDRLAPITLLYDEDPAVNPSRWFDMADKIKAFYFPNNTAIGKETSQSLIDMYSDRWFIHGIQEEALLLAKYNKVYPYILSYVGGQSVLEVLGIKHVMGVAHGDDIQYFFDGVYSQPISSSRDINFSRNIIKLWVSFVETGTPTDIWAQRGQSWPMITQENLKSKEREFNWLQLNDGTKIVSGQQFRFRMNFWNHLVPFDR